MESSLPYSYITSHVSNLINRKTGRRYCIALFLSSAFALWGIFAMIFTVYKGVGIWGINDSVVWALDITNFVFWIGIGHAGTLISAILLLFRQNWRSSFSRSAEAMTIFAIICAAIFAVIHTGRQWFTTYWLFPYPSRMGIYPNFLSPLVWDMFAILTYFTVSLIFWYVGMIPDLAALRSKVNGNIKRKLYIFFSLGWKGSYSQWNNYNKMYLLLAGLATPLVISVHTVVSFDFAVTLLPGWHSTLFPPYFVSGAIYSGCAMVVMLTIISRKILGLEEIIKIEHIDKLSKILLTTGLFVVFSYLCEFFFAWYGGNPYDNFEIRNRFGGVYSGIFISMILLNSILPQFLWSGKTRRSIPIMLIISILINIGMWLERFSIIVISLHRDFLPSSWNDYSPTWVEISILLGSFGLFFTFYLLFIRFVPIISLFEVKGHLEAEHE